MFGFGFRKLGREHHEFVRAQVVFAAAVRERTEQKDMELHAVFERGELRHRQYVFDRLRGLGEFVGEQGLPPAFDGRENVGAHACIGGRGRGLREGGRRRSGNGRAGGERDEGEACEQVSHRSRSSHDR